MAALGCSSCSLYFYLFHKKLKIIERESDVFKETEDFKRKVFSLFTNFNIDTINIDKNHQHMHDLTHLNEYGASELSYKLSLELLKNDSTTLYIAH